MNIKEAETGKISKALTHAIDEVRGIIYCRIDKTK